MSENVGKMRQKARLEYIEKNILFQTQREIAEQCGVTQRTIERDIEKWKQKGGFTRFLNKEFFELYGKEKLEYPSKALDRVMYLLAKYESFIPPLKVKKNASVTTLLRRYRTIIEEEETEETTIIQNGSTEPPTS